MSERRIVVEHPDGRRLTIAESDFDNPDANPLNWAHDAHAWDSNRNETVVTAHAAKPAAECKSLKAEGFKPYAYIHGPKCDRSCRHEKDVAVLAGHEIKLSGRDRS